MNDNNFNFFGPSYIADDNIKHLIFLFHGYGANGNDLIDLASVINKVIPNTAFYAPNAPFTLNNDGFYLPTSYQWFPLEGYDPEKVKQNPEYFNNLCNQRLQEALKILPDLWQYIDHQAKFHNVLPADIVIVGFSQGGFMALISALLKTEKLGGAISFSGVPLGDATGDLIKNALPILLTHGDSDEIVPYYAMDLTTKILNHKKIIPQTHTSCGISHSIDGSALEKAINFLEKILLPK